MKKAQAAMDFIMTYGWAILSVFAVIGILAYFGVLSPEKYIADDCVFLQENFECISHTIASNAVSLSIRNMKGSDVEIQSLLFEDCKIEQKSPIMKNSVANIIFNGCSFGEKGSKFKEVLKLEYKESESGFIKSANVAVNSVIG